MCVRGREWQRRRSWQWRVRNAFVTASVKIAFKYDGKRSGKCQVLCLKR